jgi:hypothetical protein
LSSGDSYTAGLSADDSIQVNDAVPIKITYDDGTTQYLIPGIIDAGSLISQMGKDEIKTEISPITGDVKTTYKDGRTWMGLPGYVFLLQPHKDTEVRCTYTDDEIVFYSTTGTQSIYKKK